MPGWLKAVLIAVAAALAALVLVTLLFTAGMRTVVDTFTGGSPADPTHETAAQGGATQIQFLQTPGFDVAAPDATVVLHPALTGLPDPVAVTDPDLIRSATDVAYFTDNPSAETRMIFLSILFLSPPTNGTRATMVSLFQDGREVATLTCFTGLCPRQGPPTSPFDLAGLEIGATNLAFEVRSVTGVAAARAFEADVLSRPGHLLVYGIEGLPELANTFDGFVWLDLPSTFGPWQQDATYSGDDEDATFRQALQDLQSTLPFEIGVDFVSLRQEHTGYQVFVNATDRIAVDVTGYGISDGWLPHLRPAARLWVARENVPALRQAIQAAPWPEPTPPPADAVLTARLPSLIEIHGLTGAPDDYRHQATIYDTRDALRVTVFTQPQVSFGYYRPTE